MRDARTRWLPRAASCALTVLWLGAIAAGCSELPLDVESPGGQTEFRLGQEVRLWAAWDGKRVDQVKRFKKATIRWVSNRDGQLGTGAELRTSGLSQGVHFVEAQVWIDGLHEGHLDGDLTIAVSEGQRPRVRITSHPETSVAIPAGQPLRLTGEAIDPEEGRLSGAQLTWVVAGAVRGQGEELLLTDLAPGELYTVWLKARDSVGDEGQARLWVTVRQAEPAAPSAATGASGAPPPPAATAAPAGVGPASAGLAGALGE